MDAGIVLILVRPVPAGNAYVRQQGYAPPEQCAGQTRAGMPTDVMVQARVLPASYVFWASASPHVRLIVWELFAGHLMAAAALACPGRVVVLSEKLATQPASVLPALIALMLFAEDQMAAAVFVRREAVLQVDHVMRGSVLLLLQCKLLTMRIVQIAQGYAANLTWVENAG